MTDPKPPTDLARRSEEGAAVARRDDSNGLDLLDKRIANPETSIQDAMILTKIRGEVIKQNEYRLHRDAARRAKSHQFWGKLLFSAGAVGTGGVLIAIGLHLEGFVILGAGFHWLAPDFVKSVYGRVLAGKDKDDAE